MQKKLLMTFGTTLVTDESAILPRHKHFYACKIFIRRTFKTARQRTWNHAFQFIDTVQVLECKLMLCVLFLDALAKLRKVTISVVMSIYPYVNLSVCMVQLRSHHTDFH